jgi:hypothetical protein
LENLIRSELLKDQAHPLKIKSFEPSLLKALIKPDSLVDPLGSALEKLASALEDDS